MTLSINPKTIWDSCLDIASFAGVGYLSGRAVNWFTKWTSAPSIFKKTEQLDLTGVTICCALFATIDHVAYLILGSFLEKQESDKPIYSALRIGASAIAAVSLFNAITPHLKLASVETKPAVAVILTAMVIYSQILSHLAIFNGRYRCAHVSDEDYSDI